MTIPFTIVGDSMATRQPLYFSSTNKWIKYDQMGGFSSVSLQICSFQTTSEEPVQGRTFRKKKKRREIPSDSQRFFVGQVADTTDDLQGMTREVGDEETGDLSGVRNCLVGGGEIWKYLENLQKTYGNIMKHQEKHVETPVNWKWSRRDQSWEPLLVTNLFFHKSPSLPGSSHEYFCGLQVVIPSSKLT